jgi:hypothetical protein
MVHRLVRLAPRPLLPPAAVRRALHLREAATATDPPARAAWHYYRLALCDVTGEEPATIDAYLDRCST